MDLHVQPGLTIPERELSWRFSRSSGPGGQHVNTSDSRVELLWNIESSMAITPDQRHLLLQRLNHRLSGSAVSVVSSEQRSQLRNRASALRKLAELVSGALAADPPPRRPTKPTRGSTRRHLAAKQQRSATKRNRQRPATD